MAAWRDEAACQTHDPEIFYADRSDVARVAAATAVCRTCPVRGECLQAAMVARETFGIWGGLTSQERSRLYRRGLRAAQRKQQPVKEKRCSDCRKVKPRSEFTIDRGRAGGLNPYCTPCYSAKRQEKRQQKNEVAS